jgi:23S rRNA (adenine2503-C2)-methyltransferase
MRTDQTEERPQTADIGSMTKEELAAWLAERGEKKFRAAQVFSWIHRKQAASYEEMTNIPKALRETLAKEAALSFPEEVLVVESKKHDTKKFLFRLIDGHVIESVWMKHRHGNSVCISSQVGCAMGCRFCASTLSGCVRNLTAYEMLGQVYQITRSTGERVSNIDVMGSGEPLANYDSLIRFLKLVSDPDGLNLSLRSVTVSTCGLVPQIRALAKEKLPITLAISLHASNDEKRKELMPIANRYTIAELLDACREYFALTGRRISFEYALIAGENDTDACAAELAALLSGMNCHVNLIPVNPIKERNYRRSGRTEVVQFDKKLEKYGINVTIRREMGADIDGACGQLRRNYLTRRVRT